MKQVTFALTACGRPDLLERTMDSFISHNTYPIDKYIITEDSTIAGLNDKLIVKYSDLNIEWIINETRKGQIESIDNMYSKIGTDYIFHCEDDWLFTQDSFIEKSMEILDNNSNILLVWLRAHNDTNGHPVTIYNNDYDLINYNYLVAWHGFTFNPALRRLSDYKLVAPYSSVGHEYDLSIRYKELGFKAAILKDKHVEHIGWNRHMNDINK
jgi:hypothetical protein